MISRIVRLVITGLGLCFATLATAPPPWRHIGAGMVLGVVIWSMWLEVHALQGLHGTMEIACMLARRLGMSPEQIESLFDLMTKRHSKEWLHQALMHENEDDDEDDV